MGVFKPTSSILVLCGRYVLRIRRKVPDIFFASFRTRMVNDEIALHKIEEVVTDAAACMLMMRSLPAARKKILQELNSFIPTSLHYKCSERSKQSSISLLEPVSSHNCLPYFSAKARRGDFDYEEK